MGFLFILIYKYVWYLLYLVDSASLTHLRSIPPYITGTLRVFGIPKFIQPDFLDILYILNPPLKLTESH